MIPAVIDVLGFRRWRAARVGALAAAVTLLLGALACTEEGLIKPFIPDAVEVQAPRETLRPGEVMVLKARLLASDVSITTDKASWSSTNPAVATVDTGGLVTAVSRGQTVLGAAVRTADGRALRGTAVLTVVGVQAVTVEGVPASLVVGTNAQLTARLTLDQGATAVPVTWSSSDPTKVTVSGSGVVTGVAIGSATVTATAEGRSGTALVRVVSNVAQMRLLPAAATLVTQQSAQFTAVAVDAAGAILPGQAITWSSTAPTVATVSAAGLVTAVAPGASTVTATEVSTGRSATSVVTVVPRVVSAAISPGNPSFFQGQTLQLTVSLFDATGTLLTGRPVIWQSSSPEVATVGRGTGVVTGVAAGTATIVAIDSLSGFAANTAVTVVAPVATLVVSPPATTLTVGGSQQLIASALDANGAPLTGRPVTWSSSNSAVAAVSALGLVTGVSPGTATITATVEGKTASAAITVSPPPVASVRVAPATASLVVSAVQQFTATAFDTDGNVLTGRAVIWSSSNAAVATVAATGLATAVSPGSATVVATVEGRTATASLVITAPPVHTVTVSPATAALVTGATQPLTATLRDVAGVQLPGREVTWSSSAPAVAAVSASGVVTAVTVGTATITATSEGRSGTAAITVTNPPAAAVAVDPPSASLLPGEQVAFTARVTDAAGNVLNGRTITWASANPAVVSVTAAGRATAVAAGTTTVSATVEGRAGTASVTVNAPVASVSITPATAALLVGSVQQLTATSRDSAGNALQRRPVAWNSTNSSVATVSAQGLVAGVSTGNATITATVEGRTASAQVAVALAPVSTVQLQPSGGFMPIGIGVPLVVTLRDTNSNVLSGRTVAWASSDAARGTVTAAGVVTAVTASAFNITATSEGRSAAATFEGRTGLRSGDEQLVTNATVGGWTYFAVWVPPGSTSLSVAISGGTGDPDLGVWRPGNTATPDCYPDLTGSSERCDFVNASVVPGVWLVGVKAYAAHAQTRLTATVRP